MTVAGDVYKRQASSRETCIDRMYFDAEGHIVPVRMTRKGVEARPIPAAGKAR